jgi:hypothetical protein
MRNPPFATMPVMNAWTDSWIRITKCRRLTILLVQWQGVQAISRNNGLILKYLTRE